MKGVAGNHFRNASSLALLTAMAAPGSGAWARNQAESAAITSPAVTTTASESSAAADGSDIVVTARRRDETLIAVPVTVSAISGEKMSLQGITNLEGVSKTIPSLFLAESGGSRQGGTIGLRGISAGDGNDLGDQAVAFEIDGVLVARSTPRRFSELDTASIQVLKGPQALFFGKNSPAGVVVIRSADPGLNFEAGGNAQYEFKAREVRGQGFVSVPLSNGLGLRVAAMGSTMRGWALNIATPGTIYEPRDRTSSSLHEFATRATLKFDDGGPLTARAKFSYGYSADDNGQTLQRTACPSGISQAGGADDCTADDRYVKASLGPKFGQSYYLFGDGEPVLRQKQYIGGLELHYKLSDDLTLQSTTGYYRSTTFQIDSFNDADTSFPFNPAAGPFSFTGILGAAFKLRIREISQELRLASTLDGPINFIVGGYFQDQKGSFLSHTMINGANPLPLQPPLLAEQSGKAYSAFGSFIVQPAPTLELSGGIRYSKEDKSISFFRGGTGVLAGVPYNTGTPVPTLVPSRSFSNWSPEATITWRPTSDFTAFIGWKRGFLSGGFNPTATGSGVAVIPDRSFNPEIVEGFEGGIKAALLNNTLRANLSAYNYKINDLQVFSTLAETGAQILTNAATARTKGVEGEVTWEAIPGLELHAAVGYNRARFIRYTNAPCWGGQTLSEGCNLVFIPATGRFSNQNLSGRPLVRAPDWGISLGSTYEFPINAGATLALSANGNYQSKFYSDALDSPGALQPSYWLLDASARLTMVNGIQLSLIGRNLTDVYYVSRTGDVPLTGTPAGLPTSTRSETWGAVSRGRQIYVKVAFKFH